MPAPPATQHDRHRKPEHEGREITHEELAHWRKTGVWPHGVSKSADYVELTPDEFRAMGETGMWPVRLG
jgi:hypothetical protein